MFAQRPQLLDAIRQRLREHDYVETDRHLHDDGRAVPPTAASKTSPTIRGRLFRKYVALFVGVVSVALLGNGLFEMWFSYQEHKTSLIHVQREADAAAAKIGQFIKEIESQVGWTTQLPWSEGNQEQRRLDGLRLLRQVPAIAELAEFDATGREQLRVSHLAMDVVGSQSDFSNDPKFLEAVAHKVYYGPVYFRHESEPYMTLALAGVRRDSGVSVAEVNLKLIWDVVSQIKVGQRGYAYVVDAQGRLIAHPDISLVLRNTDLSRLAHIRTGSAETTEGAPDLVQAVEDIEGRRVLAAHAQIAPLGWRVFVEMPIGEAYAPLFATIQRTGLLLVAGIVLAFFAGLFLARSMMVPIQALRAGAARIGGGNLGQRIKIKTGDELEALADQFNDMAGRLQESYADLEKKVDVRTHELAQSVEELRALGEVSQAVNSTLEVETLLNTIVAKAVQLSGTEAGAIYVCDESSDEFLLRATCGMSESLIVAIKAQHVGGADAVGRAAAGRDPIHVADVRDEPASAMQEILLREGYRALLVVPLLSPDRAIGALVIRRKQPGLFRQQTLDLLQTFAAQSVLAIQNARLFREIEEKSRQLEVANLAQSRFLAAASHDLRQPPHALGLFVAQLRARVNAAERTRLVEHIHGAVAAMNELFDALLDIAKLDAGALAPDLTEFPIEQLLKRTESTFAIAAREKGLRLRVLPSSAWVCSDFILLERILLNLVSNALRYASSGGVLVGCRRRAGTLRIEVCDSGPGIPEDQRQNIFAEFYQLVGPERNRHGGLGLGLAIVERLCRLLDHPLELTSTLGRGSRFTVVVPLVAAPAKSIDAPLAPPIVLDATAGKLVVVIDDDEMVLAGMGGMLKGWGCQVVTAASDGAALTGLTDHERRPDLIISDYRLADGKDGIEAIERLRSEFGAPIPAFLVSGDTSAERLRAVRTRGYHLLHKPVPPMALRAMVSRLLTSR
jgi:signal transduction histidine kinase/CheY-like chemotaxis protein